MGGSTLPGEKAEPLGAQRLPRRRESAASKVGDSTSIALSIQVYLMPVTTGRVGVLPHTSALISSARLWQMTLPADGDHKAVRPSRPAGVEDTPLSVLTEAA